MSREDTHLGSDILMDDAVSPETARIGAVLRRQQDVLARVQQIGQVGGIDIDIAAGLTSLRSPEYLRLHGLAAETGGETHGDWLARVHPDDREAADRRLSDALNGSGLTYDSQYRIVRPLDGVVRWIHARADIERDGEGRAVRLVGAHLDVTEMKRRQAWVMCRKEALQAAMNGEPLATSLGFLARTAVDEWDGELRCAFYVAGEEDGVLRHVVGMPDAYALRVSRSKYAPERSAWGQPGDRPVIAADVLTEPQWAPWRRLAGDFDYRGCWLFPLAVGATSPVGSFVLYFRDPREPTDGELEDIGALVETAAIIVSRHQESQQRSRAEAALRASEAHKSLLLAELQHRVRNLLGIVRSIASGSLENAPSLELAASHLEGRLTALARTQATLTRTVGVGIDLELLIRDELEAQTTDEDCVTLSGPAVQLSPRAAEVLTLAVHELATNALKHGALTTERGALSVAWEVHPVAGGPDELELVWRESGVSVLAPAPRRQGFGHHLLTQRIPYDLLADVDFEIRLGGAWCRIRFPLVPGGSVLLTDEPRRP